MLLRMMLEQRLTESQAGNTSDVKARMQETAQQAELLRRPLERECRNPLSKLFPVPAPLVIRLHAKKEASI